MGNATKTTHRAACATCCVSLVFHEIRDGRLIAAYRNGEKREIGITRMVDGRESPRFYCAAHPATWCNECEDQHDRNDARCPVVRGEVK